MIITFVQNRSGWVALGVSGSLTGAGWNCIRKLLLGEIQNK